MQSPFPGMDPYLESRWSDVHLKFIAFLGEAIQSALPRDLRARVEESLVENNEGEENESISEVEWPRAIRTAQPPQSGAELQPFLIWKDDVPDFDRFIQIVDTKNGNRVITAIEILSPWNKGPGRLNQRYCNKLEDYARGRVSVLEIDLLRSSRDRLPVGQQDLPHELLTAYLACVRRAWRPHEWEAYPISLRRPLPRIPVPLRRKEVDLIVDLQPLMERVYTAGGHDDIDYSQPPVPPLSKEDEPWANDLLKSAGLR